MTDRGGRGPPKFDLAPGVGPDEVLAVEALSHEVVAQASGECVFQRRAILVRRFGAGEDGTHSAAKFFEGGISGLFGATADEALQYLLGLCGLETSGGLVDHSGHKGVEALLNQRILPDGPTNIVGTLGFPWSLESFDCAFHKLDKIAVIKKDDVASLI
ncbi:hypothetical protein NOGI109294_26665 [Nocardiopsis gilva]